jgi:hypothetical protein
MSLLWPSREESTLHRIVLAGEQTNKQIYVLTQLIFTKFFPTYVQYYLSLLVRNLHSYYLGGFFMYFCLGG